MTRTHFQAIAEILRENKPAEVKIEPAQDTEAYDRYQGAYSAWLSMVQDFTVYLSKENANFNPGLFQAECGADGVL